MNLKDNPLYKIDVESVMKLNCNFQLLKNKTILITGASGLIGSVLVDMFFLLSGRFSLNLCLILISRNIEELYGVTDGVSYYYKRCDIGQEDIIERISLINKKIDYIFHLASNTHPLSYAKHPIDTVMTNILGTKQLLDLAVKNYPCRFIFPSSVEIYGDDKENLFNGFSETDFGYLDCNTVRATYNESKRLCECLCQAFKSEEECDFVIGRIARSYGPTIKKDDSKVLSQFLKNGFAGNDIILKSNGEQYFSYIYASDVACALIFLMMNGKSSQAYNIADKNSNIHLRNLAKLVAKHFNRKVIFDNPNETEKIGFSKSERAILNPSKINSLGWAAQVGIEDGIERTIKILAGVCE